MSRERPVLLLILGLFLLACGGDCGGFVPNLAEDCRTEGKCGRRTYATGDALTRNYVRDSADCAQSEACSIEGRCQYNPDMSKEYCVALTDEDCRRSERCRTEGACAVTERGECRIEPTGCQRHEGCVEDGDCVYPTAQRCDPGPVDCEQACRMEGACTLSDGVCVATRDEDCEASHFCSYGGQCALDGDRCTTSAEGCANSSFCAWNGDCELGFSVEGEQADWCADGVGVCDTVCWARGACDFIDGHCQTTDAADCLASVECALVGRCGYSGGNCYVSDAGCKASLECAAFGRCDDHMSTCVDKRLPREQWFDFRGGCLAQLACYEDGACLNGPDQVCMTAEQAGLDPWMPPPWPGNPLPR